MQSLIFCLTLWGWKVLPGTNIKNLNFFCTRRMVSWQQWVKNHLISKGLVDSQGFGISPVFAQLTISEVAITSFYAGAVEMHVLASQELIQGAINSSRTPFTLSKWLSALPCLSHILNIYCITSLLQSSS